MTLTIHMLRGEAHLQVKEILLPHSCLGIAMHRSRPAHYLHLSYCVQIHKTVSNFARKPKLEKSCSSFAGKKIPHSLISVKSLKILTTFGNFLKEPKLKSGMIFAKILSFTDSNLTAIKRWWTVILWHTVSTRKTTIRTSSCAYSTLSWRWWWFKVQRIRSLRSKS